MTAKLDLLNSIMGNRVTADAARNAKAAGTTSLPSALSIRLDRIDPDPEQPRKEFDQEEIDNLAGSIRSLGLIQPIAVRYDGDRDRYVILDGERRWRAAKKAGISSVTAIVTDTDLTPDRIMQLQLVANALRCDLSPLESAKAYRSLQSTWGCTAKELAARLNISQSKLSRTMALLELPESQQQAVAAGHVGPTVAVQKARVKPATTKKRGGKAKAVTIRTPLGVVTLAPAAGVQPVELLQAAITTVAKRGAA
jgi:ParB family chromosome partitioning protein